VSVDDHPLFIWWIKKHP